LPASRGKSFSPAFLVGEQVPRRVRDRIHDFALQHMHDILLLHHFVISKIYDHGFIEQRINLLSMLGVSTIPVKPLQ
jgi:hypothetical protein